MPEKRKSARLADMEASYTKKKVKYVEEYDESDFEYEEEASASDMDEDASDVEEIDREPEVDPEEIARLLEVAAEKAQAARQQIRALLADLSPEDARDITALLDRADAWDKPGARYSWSTLPSEIKNNIYKYVFVNDEPIKPHIWFPNVPNRRRIRKYDLGANFLRCNKEIYHEGRSILYGENTFHISPQFRVCLGERDKHAPLIQKVVVRRQKLSSTIMKYVALLKKLTEITVVGGPVWEYSVAASGGGMSHEQRLAKSFTHMTYYGQHLFHISACPTMWYVLEDNLTSNTKSDGVHKDNVVALRFRVSPAGRAISPFHHDEEDDKPQTWKVHNWAAWRWELTVADRKQFFAHRVFNSSYDDEEYPRI